jgi:hypothetical protein
MNDLLRYDQVVMQNCILDNLLHRTDNHSIFFDRCIESVLYDQQMQLYVVSRLQQIHHLVHEKHIELRVRMNLE